MIQSTKHKLQDIPYNIHNLRNRTHTKKKKNGMHDTRYIILDYRTQNAKPRIHSTGYSRLESEHKDKSRIQYTRYILVETDHEIQYTRYIIEETEYKI